MTNQIFGILTVFICCIGYLITWKYQKKGNYNVALLLSLLCGLILRIYSSSDLYLHDWDERYHALVSKNFLKHFFIPILYDNPVLPYSIKSYTTNHIWLHKQPLPLWSMALSIMLFGVNEFAIRIPSIILSTLGIPITYFIAKYFFSKRTALVAAFFFSVNGLIVEMTGGRQATDHVDIFFLFFIELSIYFSIVFVQKEKSIFNILVGLSVGAAILCKWLPALIVLPIWLLIVYNSKLFSIKYIIAQFLLICTVAIIVFVPWQIYIYHYFPVEANWEASYNIRHLTEVLDEQGGDVFYYLTQIRINYGELIYLPLVWFIWKIIKSNFNLNYIALGLWIIIPLLFFTFAQTKMQGYVLFIAPALFIITAEFYFVLSSYQSKGFQKWIIYLALILFITLPVRYLIERIKPFENRNMNPEWAIDLKKLNKMDYKNAVMFNYNKPIEAMFYTNLTVYAELPDKRTLEEIAQKGNKVLVNDNGNVPVDIKRINGIIIEHLSEMK